MLIYGGLYFNAVVSNLYLGNRDIMDDKTNWMNQELPIHKKTHINPVIRADNKGIFEYGKLLVSLI